MSSILKNVELARYHDDPNTIKSNYRTVSLNNDIMT